MLKHISFDELMHILKNKQGTLVTSNTRLMQHFHQLYAAYFQEKTFEAPAIYSHEIWLKKCWQNQSHSNSLSLLQPHQSHFLWERVIEENSPFFFHIDGLVEEVKKAWQLCWTWNIDINQQQFGDNIDTAAFLQWASAYQQILEKNHWIDEAMLPRHCAETQKTIILTGFDRYPPHLMQFFPLIYESQSKAKKIHKAAFLSEEQEIDGLLSWAKANPAKTIACVIPNLNQKRNKLERFIQRYFTEEEYNISAGHIFSQCSMIATALNMLSIKSNLHKKQTITLKDFYFILENRYLGDREEKRSDVLKEIHQIEHAQLSWKNFLRLLKKHSLKLFDYLEKFEQFNLPKKAKPSEWKTLFDALLTQLNWPGSDTLDTHEYQTYERWVALGKEYQQCDLIFESITFSDALSLLKKIASRTIFQPRKKSPRIHFLGFLEAAGIHFDALWVSGMNAEEFPSNVKLNAFIPTALQREHQLPHATHEIEYTFAQDLIQRFIHNSDEVIFSHLSQKEGLPLKESPLIQSFTYQTPIFSTSDTQLLDQRLDTPLEIISDTPLLPITPHEKIKGGTTLLKNQALCPFRAFAKHRLKALGFEPLTLGLTDHERGSLVHAVLEKFWGIVKTQAQLLAYTSLELDTLIQQITHDTVQSFIKSNAFISDKLPPFFQTLEIKRLHVLLKKWLTIEMQRPPFEVIGIEESKEIMLGDLLLKIRLDRVDQLSNGEHLVIDYKTGLLPTISTDDERPENPQLLLYALSDEKVKAWAFAQVKANETLFKGRSADETDIVGVKPFEEGAWEQERQQWEKHLTALAEEFLQGNNQVLPKKKSVCDTCDLHGLCRVREELKRMQKE